MKNAQEVTRYIEQKTIKGFLAADEGEALYQLALEQSQSSPCLEIGSYCGKSTLYLAVACSKNNAVVYAVDHHRGSEEHQLGEEYHDPELYDAAQCRMNSFPSFQRTIDYALLSASVIPVISCSAKLVAHWKTPLSLVFIDGGHSPEMAMVDCIEWAKHVEINGVLAVHDIFQYPEEGGQGPYLALQAVLDSGDFILEKKVNSLGIARRVRMSK